MQSNLLVDTSSFILTQDQKLKKKLAYLVELLLKNGAYISDDLKIHSTDTNLSIHSTSSEFNIKKTIEIPINLLPRLDEYSFKIKENKLVCLSNDSLKHLQKEILFLMIDIYNHTSKIAFHKSSNIFYTLKNHKELLKLLVSPIINDKINNYLNLLDEEKEEELLIQSFFNTRQFSLKDENKLRYTLLPLIDYLNHNALTKGFQKSENSIYVENAPSEKSSELFVSYHYYDTLETLIYYGFVDTSSPLYFSIPLKIVLNKTITIEIKNIGFKKFTNEVVPKGLEHIKEIIPHMQKVNEQHIVVSKLLIPNRQLPFALRKFLHLLLNELGIKQNQEIRMSIIQAIEKELITQNIAHYKKVESFLENNTQENLKILITHNLSHLRNYGSWFQK